MVHKKYIKRGNKIFGPYLYQNYRVNGITKTKYLGLAKEEDDISQDKQKNGKNLRGNWKFSLQGNREFILGFSIAVILVLAVFSYFFFSGLTGRATLNVASSYISGENISGNLALTLKEGELIPLNSIIQVDMAGSVKEFSLSDFLQANNNGSFYSELNQGSATPLSGEGEGYGFIGKKTIYPEILFKLIVYLSGKKAENKTQEQPAENVTQEILTEQPTETSSEQPTETQTETPQETPTETPQETPTEIITEPQPTPEQTTETPPSLSREAEDQSNKETPATITETPAETTPSSETAITGGAVKENKKEIDGKISKGNDFVYNLESGETAGIKKNSVKIEETDKKGKLKEKKIDDNQAILKISGQEARVSTDYSIEEQGFGQDYLGKENSVSINLSKLNIIARAGTLKISLMYENIILAEASKEISVAGENLGFENVTKENITLKNETLTLKNATLITLGVKNVTLMHYKAVMGMPVKWFRKIKLENGTLIELPKSAENITIKTGSEIADAEKALENSAQEIESADKTSLITGNIVFETNNNGLFTRMFRYFRLTGSVISESEIGITETDTSKIIDVSGIANPGDEILIEYYTPAPAAVEENTVSGKKITISAADELNYTDILAYTTIPEKVRVENNKSIRIYHLVWHEADQTQVNATTNQSEIIENETTNQTQVNVTTNPNGVVGVNNSISPSPAVETNNASVVPAETPAGNSNTSAGITGNVALEINESEAVNVSERGGYWAREEVEFTAYDLDEDGNIDYVEWNVPHLSEQIYEIIIEISKAEELDENRIFVRDVYPEVSQLDGNYTEIPDGHYVRVTFKQNLTNKRDITIYAKAGCNGSIEINGRNVPCAIYEEKMRIDEIKKELENE